MSHGAHSSQPVYETFVSKIQGLQKLYARAGYFIRALSSEPNARERFSALPLTQQNSIVQKLQNDLEFYTDCALKKERLNNNRNLLDIFACRQKVNIPASAIERIHSNSLVELYDHNLIQRFRSVNFFSYTSHSLEDLESRPYYELFRKSEETERKIGSVVTNVFSGTTVEPDFTTVGRHRLWEINSPRKLVTQNKTVALTPVFHDGDGTIAGILHICNVIRQTEFSVVRNLPQAEATDAIVKMEP